MPGPNCKATYKKTIYGWQAVCSDCDWQRIARATKTSAENMFRAHKHDLEISYPQVIQDALHNLRQAGLID